MSGHVQLWTLAELVRFSVVFVPFSFVVFNPGRHVPVPYLDGLGTGSQKEPGFVMHAKTSEGKRGGPASTVRESRGGCSEGKRGGPASTVRESRGAGARANLDRCGSKPDRKLLLPYPGSQALDRFVGIE